MILDIKREFGCPLQILSETFLILRRIERDMIINAQGFHEEYPLFLSGFKETWNFPTDFRKNIQKWTIMNILSLEAELFHEDGRTDGQIDKT